MNKHEYALRYIATRGELPDDMDIIPTRLPFPGWQVVTNEHQSAVVTEAKAAIEHSIIKTLLPEHVVAFKQFILNYRETIDWVLWYNETEPTDTTPRYHNSRHLIGAAFIASLLDGNEEVINAMFIHDFQHLGESKDKENIAHSLATAAQCQFPGGLLPSLIDLVSATEYDPSNPIPDIEILQAGMCRDADQIYATMMFDMDVYLGLEHEVGRKLGTTGMAFLQRNMDYVRNIGDNLYLSQSKDLHKRYQEFCLKRHLEVASIMYVN